MTSKKHLVGQEAPPAHLVVRGIDKSFGGLQALREADFEVARGEVERGWRQEARIGSALQDPRERQRGLGQVAAGALAMQVQLHRLADACKWRKGI